MTGPYVLSRSTVFFILQLIAELQYLSMTLLRRSRFKACSPGRFLYIYPRLDELQNAMSSQESSINVMTECSYCDCRKQAGFK